MTCEGWCTVGACSGTPCKRRRRLRTRRPSNPGAGSLLMHAHASHARMTLSCLAWGTHTSSAGHIEVSDTLYTHTHRHTHTYTHKS
eukprot:XP_001693247.1 predicted protein [Chlamydomonas reinhardtii]